MVNLSYKTISANSKTVDKKWVLIDATDIPLGRLASLAAYYLRGKQKINFTPHVDCGDYVIVINSKKVKLTGNKLKNKKYIRHTGYPGGQRKLSAEQIISINPNGLIEKAVKGMLPKNKLGDSIFKNLKVFAYHEHNHEAQKPKIINLN